jgi:uncharacterized protein YdeI (YjbR/CyaY-like superfamily)
VLGYVGRQTPAKKTLVTGMAESTTFEPQTVAALNRFFEENKDKCHEIWIVITKKKTANPQPISFNQAVNEAKKHGLIDSRTKTIDDKKYMIRFTKRIKP